MEKVQQLSIFAENRPGRLEKITRVLGENSVNILATAIVSTNGFGVIKFMVDKCELALAKLREAGFTVTLSEVLAIEMKDKPGGLHDVVQILSEKGVNIENASVYVAESRKRAYLLVEVKDIAKAKQQLKNSGLTFLSARQQGPA
ncbi:MAG TPA: ACT domain-containing protein [Dissulfurispiraceae bacterium]|nr:ACT domain-containing protein [Dissulfurispiraceae bacterium]